MREEEKRHCGILFRVWCEAWLELRGKKFLVQAGIYSSDYDSVQLSSATLGPCRRVGTHTARFAGQGTY
jgi:hypothetical protein